MWHPPVVQIKFTSHRGSRWVISDTKVMSVHGRVKKRWRWSREVTNLPVVQTLKLREIIAPASEVATPWCPVTVELAGYQFLHDCTVYDDRWIPVVDRRVTADPGCRRLFPTWRMTWVRWRNVLRPVLSVWRSMSRTTVVHLVWAAHTCLL